MIDLICFTDGGFNNLTKTNGYGSFKIFSNNEEIVKRMDLAGISSSNEAEYLTLIRLLQYIKENYPEDITIKIFGDSKLIVNQVNGIWKIREERLFPYYKTSTDLFNSFKSITLVWVPRNIIVKQLGH